CIVWECKYLPFISSGKEWFRQNFIFILIS
ncbi:MAG: hypothetical protein ACI942_003483, partial [Planctomycetota bacterium]